jgi:hypothetical protein
VGSFLRASYLRMVRKLAASAFRHNPSERVILVERTEICCEIAAEGYSWLMPVYPILVDAWQFECCGEPFAVGDTVSFPLELLPPDRFSPELHVALRTATPAGALRDEQGSSRQLYRAGGLIAAAGESGEPAGVLHEDRHRKLPQDMPATTGVAERISVGRVLYRREGEKWVPVGGSMVLEPVERTPERFDSSPDGKEPPWGEAGMVIHLRVD